MQQQPAGEGHCARGEQGGRMLPRTAGGLLHAAEPYVSGTSAGQAGESAPGGLRGSVQLEEPAVPRPELARRVVQREPDDAVQPEPLAVLGGGSKVRVR